MTDLPPLESAVLPAGIRSRFLDGINGLRMHVLEAGFAPFQQPGYDNRWRARPRFRAARQATERTCQGR